MRKNQEKQAASSPTYQRLPVHMTRRGTILAGGDTALSYEIRVDDSLRRQYHSSMTEA
jgi:hypothetical protein